MSNNSPIPDINKVKLEYQGHPGPYPGRIICARSGLRRRGTIKSPR